MTTKELTDILIKHASWVVGGVGGEGADLRGADLEGANLEGATLWRANLEGANLRGADLEGADLNWDSHALLSEILWRAAETQQQMMLAAFVGRATDMCWDDFAAMRHPAKKWARLELKKWYKDGDGAPDWIREEKP